MKILLVNDDGIEAEGLKNLAKTLRQAGHNITVVAPDGERSGHSQYIHFHTPIFYEKRDFTNADIAYAVLGTPTDCVKLAVKHFHFDIDVVVSGINRGPNYGSDILYSGTVGAAQEGAVLGYKAIAISSAGWENNNYTACSQFVSDNLEKLCSIQSFQNVININVPNIPTHLIKGAKIARQCLLKNGYDDYYDEQIVEGRTGYSLEGDVVDFTQLNDDSDAFWVANGFVSVTALKLDRTNVALNSQLKELFE